MPVYKNQSLKTYLEELSSRTPTPGGGSAAALVAAMGSALISMVARYSLDKNFSRQVEAKIRKIIQKNEKIRHRLLDLVDLDARVYRKVIKTRKAGDEAKKKALQEARDIPREVCRLCYETLGLTPFLVEKGNVNLLSDIQVAVEMLWAAFHAAMINVEINQ